MSRSRVGVLWRRAPFVLRHHPSVLVAVFIAALLVGLAASSAPFVTTAAASEALQNRLAELTPYATGLVVTGEAVGETYSVRAALREEEARATAAKQLASRLPDVGRPVLTLETDPTAPLNITGRTGQGQVRLMARTGFLPHIHVLKETAGSGVWIWTSAPTQQA